MQSKWEGETIWIAELNNNIVAYDDTGRVNNAWLELKKYCEENNVKINKLSLKFRSHVENIPVGESYYVIRSVLAFFKSEVVHNYFNVGVLNNNELINFKYKIPELLLHSKEVRNIESYRNILI